MCARTDPLAQHSSNLSTAKALGLTVASCAASARRRADRVKPPSRSPNRCSRPFMALRALAYFFANRDRNRGSCGQRLKVSGARWRARLCTPRTASAMQRSCPISGVPLPRQHGGRHAFAADRIFRAAKPHEGSGGQSFGQSFSGLSERFQNINGGLLFGSPNATPRRPTLGSTQLDAVLRLFL